MTDKTKKPMPVWAMVITDIVLTAAAIGVFMLFDYVMPQSSGVKGEVIATVDSSAEGSFTLPNAADNPQKEGTAQDDSEPAVTTTAPQAEKATTTLRTEQTNHRNWGNQDTADYRSDQNAISSITNGAKLVLFRRRSIRIGGVVQLQKLARYLKFQG